MGSIYGPFDTFLEQLTCRTGLATLLAASALVSFSPSSFCTIRTNLRAILVNSGGTLREDAGGAFWDCGCFPLSSKTDFRGPWRDFQAALFLDLTAED